MADQSDSISAQKNPTWDEAELILTMDLYYNHVSNTKHGSTAEKQELSDLLRSMNLFEDIPNPEKFRNFAGVNTKISNLMYLDPEEPSKGLSGASLEDKRIWEKYAGKPALLHELAAAIRQALAKGEAISVCGDPDEEASFPEGKVLYRMHRQRERNGRAVEAAKQKAAKEGNLHCCICGFDFEKAYGQLGHGYIEAHHTKPISEYKAGDVTKVEDLALVCANCHRMLHRKRPWLGVSELKELISNNE